MTYVDAAIAIAPTILLLIDNTHYYPSEHMARTLKKSLDLSPDETYLIEVNGPGNV
jgi:hypothetical protein